MKIELTRHQERGGIHIDSNVKNTVTLIISDLHRAESDFFYEALTNFLNKSSPAMKRYFDENTDLKKWEKIYRPEREILAGLIIEISNTRIQKGQKYEMQEKLAELKKLFEELR